MEQQQFLIDTNAVIDYLGNKIPQKGMEFMNTVVDEIPNVSVITKIEVLGFNAHEDHYQLLLDFMEDTTILELSDAIVDICISLRKMYKIKLPDAIIAATAIGYNLTLISRNTTDFKHINGLTVVDPYML